jgi:hypothetical protein
MRGEVRGVNILLQDRNTFDAPELGVELASALHKYPNDFKMDRMLVARNQATFDAIVAGQDRDGSRRGEGLGTFISMREISAVQVAGWHRKRVENRNNPA